MCLGVALALLCATGCVRTVLEGEDPDVARPVATGDIDRDVLLINVPWMQAPVPRLLLDGNAVQVEQVSARTPELKTSYLLRSRGGITAEIEISTDYPSNDVVDFTYRIKRLPRGYTLDLPIGLGQVGRRGPIAIAVNGAPFDVPPSANVALIDLARDERTRIRCTRLPTPAPGQNPSTAPTLTPAPPPPSSHPGHASHSSQ